MKNIENLFSLVNCSRDDYLGCYVDQSERDLSGHFSQQNKMSPKVCIQHCSDRGFKYAGVQYANQCFCGDTYGRYGKSDENDCSTRCAGHPTKTCGGTWRNSIYKTKNYLGCYVDQSERDLSGHFSQKDYMSARICIQHCSDRGFKYAGVQYANQCFCGDTYGRYGKSDENDCSTRCAGHPTKTCGGTWRNSIYETKYYLGCYVDQSKRDLSGQFLQQKKMSARVCIQHCSDIGFKYAGVQNGNQCFCGDTYGRYGKSDENNCGTRCAGHPKQTCGGTWRNSIHKTRYYLGCYVDQSERDLSGHFSQQENMSPRICIQHCSDRGFKFAGVQYANQCFCGDTYGRYGKSDENDCSTRCTGHPKNICGGTWRNSVYRTKYYLGCYVDQGKRGLPEEFSQQGNMSSTICIEHCSARGFKYAGVQYANQCFCGDTYGRYGESDESDCSTRCAGHPTKICGGTWRNSIYKTKYYLGCYVDRSERDLSVQFSQQGNMSARICIQHCSNRGFNYAGVQDGKTELSLIKM